MSEHFSFSPESMDQPKRYTVPESELRFFFARSGGPGGQNVNKRKTKARIEWPFSDSLSFTDDQKLILERELQNWINDKGCVVVSNRVTRSQDQNRQNAIDRLNEIVTEALTPEKERIATKPTRSSKERRLDDKKLESNKKKDRQLKNWE
jgi:ribosome-associated protein